MKLNILYLFTLIFVGVLQLSCERDDICIDEITPHLKIKLYDKNNPTELKKINKVDINIINLEAKLPPFISKDSILVPLNVSQNKTQYILTINSDNPDTKKSDTITVTYTREDIFVGRSCGYKTIFNTVTYNLESHNWIANIESILDKIENENEAHVKIFF